MALVINHNLMALTAFNNLTRSYNALSKSVNRLSSGLRINGASDDAAGLAVRELMRSDVTVLNQGVRNANDAISMLQTMDGAASVIDEKLIRMKELAEQAATGTYTSAQRTIMNNEFSQMRTEIDRIAQATDFNGVKMLNSATGTVTIHFGTGNDSSEDYYSIHMKDLTSGSNGLNTTGVTIASQASAQAALTRLDSAITTKDTARAHFGAMMNRLQATVTNLTIQAQNIQAAESQISDVDVAREMTTFINNQIKAQTATAMLSQANMVPQMAMKLIG
ncbi:MAG: flagellin [Deltaproteobacteria bacterium]|nr:flagellin [Deltaproteobacteria bacterium]